MLAVGGSHLRDAMTCAVDIFRTESPVALRLAEVSTRYLITVSDMNAGSVGPIYMLRTPSDSRVRSMHVETDQPSSFHPSLSDKEVLLSKPMADVFLPKVEQE